MTAIEKTLTDIVNSITDEAYQSYSDEELDAGKHITDLIRRIGKSSLRVGDERIYLVCGWDLPGITGALEHEYSEHANQQPLTLEDLEDMHDLPVYLSDRDVWAIVNAEDDDVWLVINGETPGHPEVLLAGWQIDRGEMIYANKPLGDRRTCRECYDGPRKSENEKPVPLTLEQLRGMDGEPVWFVSKRNAAGEWVLINAEDSCVVGSDSCVSGFNTYDDGWLAYAHKL